MKKIAVTGGIACGKSVVGSILVEEGIPVCEADEVAHHLMVPGGACVGEIVEAFGRSVLDEDGGVDRSALGEVVFANSGKLATLNGILHPRARAEWEAWLERQCGEAASVVVPLLYEAGMQDGWDAVICVGCRRADQAQRLAGRGLDARQIEARLGAQMDLEGKMERADYVIFNCGTLDEVRSQTLRILSRALEKEHVK